jgi:hypothetical protein
MIVITRLVWVIHFPFSTMTKMDRPHEAGDDE